MTAVRVDPAVRPLRSALVAPRSLGLLLLALLLAGIFAALAQWQLSRAVEAGRIVPRPTERVLPLNRVAQPAAQQTKTSVGQSVETAGRLIPGDTVLIGDRLNDGTRGWWVVGHAIVDDPAGAQLAVALGWASDRDAAEQAAAAVRAAPEVDRTLRGRYVDSDPAEPTRGGPPSALIGVSTARLVNVWDPAQAGPVYEGILTLDRAPAGLTTIYSPVPQEQVELNLLNILYAAEWVLFAGFALYIWYRLVRDRWELEQQDPADIEGRPAEPARTSAGPPSA